MFDILNYYQDVPKTQKAIDGITQNANTYIYNIAENAGKLLVISLFKQTSKTMIVVYPNIYEATIAYEDYLELLEADQISFFPVEELVITESITTSSSYRLERLKTIFNILNDIPQIIITSTEGLTHLNCDMNTFKEAIIKIKIGMNLNRNELLKEIVSRGYQKVSFVENPGTYSVRGSIIDIYTLNLEKPLRIEFFDDEIETLKFFDVTTQRSINKIDEVLIYPFHDIIYFDKSIPTIVERLKKDIKDSNTINHLEELLKNRESLDSLYLYLPYINPAYQTLSSMIKDKYLIFNHYNKIIEKEKVNNNELYQDLSSALIPLNSAFLKPINEFIYTNSKNVFLESFCTKFDNLIIDYQLDYETSDSVDYINYLSHMIEEFKLNLNKTYIITHIDDTKLKLIKELLENNSIKYICPNSNKDIQKQRINLMVSPNAIGYSDYSEKFEIITPKQFAKNKIFKQTKYQKQSNNTVQVYNKDELQIGDYVVHQDYGIGRYLGIKTINNKNIQNDYLTIEYAENGKLYIPVEKIYRLQKYLGSFDKVPKLTKLNTKEWEKKKARIKEKLIQIAKDLIKTQAKREILKGFKYQKDSEEQIAFENDFEYTETLDQIKAIEEVKKDMESDHPLDRLICGDVGFGKTEVALRAAFKAVDNGKQVVVLAPTTVLSRQHYNTFKERFEKYGMRVELLNRYIDKKQQTTIIDGLRAGYVDVVIGTHRVLSNDIQFKNLGMLIIDEEQKFGVVHKEKIKQLKANIDVISMSATPIPRTLQMSLSSLKEMSLIETPPVNRKSVQTYVLKKNDAVIREAIYKEMARNGQIFYLLNRIDKLDDVLAKIKSLVPQAKIAMIHGRMDKEKVEQSINSFLNHEYDVLVCTTIVETGIDIPNANTLIIEQADHLGLAQLYQIRGRVGRSEKIAYAYLMYDNELTLSDVARKRLNAIKEFTALGSGYKIAMRDLSIRGAGDILGDEQSGFIDDIGIDLYLQMLDEAIKEEKGLLEEAKETKQLDLNISKTIENSYVDEDILKIAIHQEIAKVFTKQQAKDLILELNDRYGKMNNQLKVYIYSKYLETLLKQKGIEKYKVSDNQVELNFDQEHTANIQYIYFLQTAKRIAPNYDYQYFDKKIHIKIRLNESNKLYSDNSYIYQLIEFMENI